MHRLTLATCFVLTCLVAGLSTGTAAAKDWTEVRIGFEGDYPPFNSINANNKLVGFDVDIAKALCAEMGVTCRYFSAHNDAGLSTLTRWLLGQDVSEDDVPDIESDIDAIVSSMWITEERKQRMAFTRPYYNTPNSMVKSNRERTSITKLSDLRPLTVGVVADSPQERYLRKHMSSPNLRRFGTFDEIKASLSSQNGITVAIGDAVAVNEWMTSGNATCCSYLGAFDPDTDEAVNGKGAGIATRRADDDLRAMFDTALARILANGTYDKIRKTYFKIDIYGSDR